MRSLLDLVAKSGGQVLSPRPSQQLDQRQIADLEEFMGSHGMIEGPGSVVGGRGKADAGGKSGALTLLLPARASHAKPRPGLQSPGKTTQAATPAVVDRAQPSATAGSTPQDPGQYAASAGQRRMTAAREGPQAGAEAQTTQFSRRANQVDQSQQASPHPKEMVNMLMEEMKTDMNKVGAMASKPVHE